MATKPASAATANWSDILERQGVGQAVDFLRTREGENLAERIQRLRVFDEDYRADHLGEAIPKDRLHPKLHHPQLLDLWRASHAQHIRPGDWVALDCNYACEHMGTQPGARRMLHDSGVSPAHVAWAGTDENEFFYLPHGLLNHDARSLEEYVEHLSPDQARMIEFGEEHSLARFDLEIERVREHVMKYHDADACGVFHGPDHWTRVGVHARNMARAHGVDPLVPTLFALVHDSQREDEGYDAEHGPRAAKFVLERRKDLFAFLRDDQIEDLRVACDLHSTGQVLGTAIQRCCWDADRLDLWRVGIEPNAALLCHSESRKPSAIECARVLWEQHARDRGMLSDERQDYIPEWSRATLRQGF